MIKNNKLEINCKFFIIKIPKKGDKSFFKENWKSLKLKTSYRIVYVKGVSTSFK